MDITIEFPLLVYAVDICTREGYSFISSEEGVSIGTYHPDWFWIRKEIIERYRFHEGCLG